MALAPPPEEGTVAVVVRVRPLAPCEQRQAGHRILHVVDQHILTFDPEEQSGPPSSTLPTRRSKQQGKDLKFVFDRVLGEGATQEEVFQHTTCEMLDSILNGYNCSVFAYGATGAGKTYTMLGSEKNPGIMYRTMVELYRRIEAREEKSFKVLVSYQEVYNEQIHDLLEPKHPLAIREDPEKGVVVQGLSFHQPTSAEQLLEMLANGNKNRTQHPTNANATSSRSHAVFQIYLQQQDCIGSLTRDLQVAKMSLIDLAGSERASVTKAKGERLREGANINRSLLALINVMNALADSKSKKTHIPYRDSKLTRLLKDSIGGNCRTVMIAAVSPSILAYEDTYNTLQYASRAKEIKLSLKSNVLSFVCPVNKYAVICEQLKAEVADLQAKLRAYKDAAWEAENRAPALLGPISSSTVGLLRLEEAVPKTCLAPDFQRESDGDQQELESGWPVQLQPELEKETLEEMPPSSPRATHQTDIQLEQKKPTCLLQGLSSSQPETLLAAILNVAKKQYSLLKDADLLTPDLVSEFEELEHLVNQVVGVNLEQAMSPNRPTELSGAAPAQRMQQGCDAEASVAVSSTPVSSTTLQCLQQLALLSSSMQMALSPVKKRRKSERKSGTPRSLKTQMKCKEMCGKKVETPRAMQSLGTSCLKAAAQTSPVSTLPLCSTPKICTLTVTKGHAPLVVSPAQNCCTQPALPVHDLNVTYEICKDSNSPGMAKPVAFSMPEFPVCDNIQSILNKQDRPSVPKPHVPLFAMRSSSIPKPTVSKASARKRRQMDSTTYPSLGRLQSHMTQLLSSSQGSVKPSCIQDDLCALRMQPEHPLGAFAWKGSKRTTKRLAAHGGAPPAPTSQPMKL